MNLRTEITVDGYINDCGYINTKRLQVLLDEMALWEEEVFLKEYADTNWYMGKQTKHSTEIELLQQQSTFSEF